MIKLIKYDSSYKSAWNLIVKSADNGHFLFDRDFMEYHADRFQDCSFVIFYRDHIIGVIPGNVKDNKWYTHQGLTFGGVILHEKYNRILIMQDIFALLFKALQELGIAEITYKFMPYIYHQRPCDADLYVLSKYTVIKETFEVSSSVPLNNRNKFSELRIRGKKKSDRTGMIYTQSDDWAGYWQILTHRLQTRYSRNPVHTLAEILLLKQRFPDNIKLFVAQHALEGICAGVVVFETKEVAHCQYISTSDFGLEICALDGLIVYLIEHYASVGKRYFNFGISTEDAGKILNENLIQFKEGFGAKSIVHTTRSYNLAIQD